MKSLSCVQLFGTPRTVAYQAPPSMGFPRQEYWRGLPFSSPGDLPDPGIRTLVSRIAGRHFPAEPPGPRGSHKRVKGGECGGQAGSGRDRGQGGAGP